jgi:hypothetical protein
LNKSFVETISLFNYVKIINLIIIIKLKIHPKWRRGREEGRGGDKAMQPTDKTYSKLYYECPRLSDRDAFPPGWTFVIKITAD